MLSLMVSIANVHTVNVSWVEPAPARATGCIGIAVAAKPSIAATVTTRRIIASHPCTLICLAREPRGMLCLCHLRACHARAGAVHPLSTSRCGVETQRPRNRLAACDQRPRGPRFQHPNAAGRPGDADRSHGPPAGV